jgi:HD-like signal output (HDOD) protein
MSDVLKHDRGIPLFRSPFQKIMHLYHRADVSVDTVLEIVETDAWLTARYLKLANSAAFSPGESIRSVKEALIRIGLEEVCRLASLLAIMDTCHFFRSDWNRPRWQQFWFHTLLTARLTERLAVAYAPLTGKEYLSGVLHDVGKLFWRRFFRSEFEAVEKMAEEDSSISFTEIEYKQYQTTDAEIGSALAERWKFHPEIVQAIRFSPDPSLHPNWGAIPPSSNCLLPVCIHIAKVAAKQEQVDFFNVKELASFSLLHDFHVLGRIGMNLERERTMADLLIQHIMEES